MVNMNRTTGLHNFELLMRPLSFICNYVDKNNKKSEAVWYWPGHLYLRISKLQAMERDTIIDEIYVSKQADYTNGSIAGFSCDGEFAWTALRSIHAWRIGMWGVYAVKFLCHVTQYNQPISRILTPYWRSMNTHVKHELALMLYDPICSGKISRFNFYLFNVEFESRQAVWVLCR